MNHQPIPRPIRFYPGPAHVRDDVLAAMARPPIPHRAPAFEQMLDRVQQRLGRLLDTSSAVFPVLCCATTALEVALRGVARKSVLVVTNGAFSERLALTAASLRLDVETLAVPWGEPVDAALLERALGGGTFDTVAFVHNATATGAMSDLDALAAVVRDRPGLAVVVDAVSSFGGVEIGFDRLGPNAILASQTSKALACPPGLAILAVAPGAAERAKGSEIAGHALALARLVGCHAKARAPNTPNTSLTYALEVQLDHILAEGPARREARHREMAALVQDWALAHFGLLAREDARSPTVTTIENSRGVDVPRLIAEVARRGFLIAGGYGPLEGATFRIGHMGDVTVEQTEALLGALDESLAAIA